MINSSLWQHARTHFQGLHALRPFTPDETKLYTRLLDLVDTQGATIDFTTRRQAERALELATDALITAGEGLTTRGLLYAYSGKKPGSWSQWILCPPVPYWEAIIPVNILRQPVSCAARLLLAEVQALHSTWGLAFAEDSYFADRLYLSIRNVRAALRELIATNLLRQDIQQGRTPKRLLFPFPAPSTTNR